MKKLIKRYAPKKVLNLTLTIYKRWITFTVNRYDSSRFNKSRFHDLPRATLPHLEGKLTFHAHSIEKGLSHTNLRYNFGQSALQSLKDTIEEYKRQDYPRDRLPYVNALSTLKAYSDSHTSVGADLSKFHNILGPDLTREVLNCTSNIGGAINLSSSTKDKVKEKNFADLFNGRCSVREFSDKAVLPSRILPAINLAMKSPSVCNRQSARVKIVTETSLIERLLELQGGMKGYDTPPALLIVTADLSSFLEPTERNQPFIDGGLFSMGLLLALEYEKLAACPLNAMMTAEKEEIIRSILEMSQSERIILFIAVGEFVTQTKVPKSFRHSGEDIVTKF